MLSVLFSFIGHLQLPYPQTYRIDGCPLTGAHWN